MSSPTKILSERDPNIPQSPEKNKKGDGKQQDAPKSLEYHRQALEALKERFVDTTSTNVNKKTSQPSATENDAVDATSFSSYTASNSDSPIQTQLHRQAYTVRSSSRNQQTYISPSDTIQSPATMKLAAFKQRHVKSVKPRTLFAKTATSNAEAAAAKQTEQEKADASW